MKKLFPIALSVFLAGCITSPKLPDASLYLEVEPESPPAEIRGYWTGAMGPYISTIKLDESGRGKLCSAYAHGSSVTGIKYAEGKVYTVFFGAADVTLDQNLLTVKPDDGIYPAYEFFSDTELVEAADYCKEQLAEG
ncbi:MAG: hypothetical protein CMM07_20750 [Rhodopirellula sp.]|nr:hypothetical protein [Rhodopirellula sp.]